MKRKESGRQVEPVSPIPQASEWATKMIEYHAVSTRNQVGHSDQQWAVRYGWNAGIYGEPPHHMRLKEPHYKDGYERGAQVRASIIAAADLMGMA